MRVFSTLFLLSFFALASAEPDTQITSPEDNGGVLFVAQNEPISFAAVEPDGNDDHVIFRWQVFNESGEEVAYFNGARKDFTFTQLGRFVVTCTADDSFNGADPTPARRKIHVAQDLDFDTEVTSFSGDRVEVVLGQTQSFSGKVVGVDKPSDYDLVWTIVRADAAQETNQVEGETITHTFQRLGTYKVFLAGRDAGGYADPSPFMFTVKVVPVSLSITKPNIPRDKPYYVPLNQAVGFQASLESATDENLEITWRLLPRGDVLCRNTTTCVTTFQEPARVALAVTAKSGEIVVASDYRQLVVGPELYLSFPSDMVTEARTDTALSFSVDVVGSALEQPGDVEIYWLFNGQRTTGTTLEIGGIPRPGSYTATVIAICRRSQAKALLRHHFRVYDPQNIPKPEIISPRTDLYIRPGSTVFCDSSFRGIPSQLRQPYWEIVQLTDNDRVRKSSINETLGRYTLNDEGVYECRLFVRRNQGSELVATRTITVTSQNPSSFQSNTTPRDAAAVQAGSYRNIQIDETRYFEVDIPVDNLSFSLFPRISGEAHFALTDGSGQVIASRQINRRGVLQATGLPRGKYKLAVSPAGASKTAGKLDFGFDLAVLNPALYFTDVSVGTSYETEIGLVNPNGDEVNLEIIGYDSSGAILEKLDRTLLSNGNLTDSVTRLFGEQSDQVAWIRVDATAPLVGFSNVTSIDALESYAVGAADFLSSELYVPHIAKDTNTFFTRADVVNGLDESLSARVSAGNEEQGLENSDAFAKDTFDFVTKFEGTLPDTDWARFTELNQSAGLAGSEVFGKVDGTRQIVGLGLADAPQNNPNFTSSVTNLFFTHIAKDTANFWTAVALVNIEEVVRTVKLKAWGEAGGLQGERDIVLQPGEKLVGLADDILADAGNTENVDWIEIEADGGVVGYELFGTWNNKQMAGLEAGSQVKEEICFPYVDGTGAKWHGFAVVNVSESDTQVTFSLYDDAGNVLDTEVQSLQGKEKKIFLLTQLFDEIPFNASWVKAGSETGLAGFQLFGTTETMSGLIAQ